MLKNRKRNKHFRRKVYSCPVVGVTFENDDGVNRQFYVKRMRIGDEIILEREPDNKYWNEREEKWDGDKWAIKVLNDENEMLGYIPKNHLYIPGFNKHLAERLDAGEECECEVHDITNINTDKPYGLKIIIKFKEE